MRLQRFSTRLLIALGAALVMGGCMRMVSNSGDVVSSSGTGNEIELHDLQPDSDGATHLAGTWTGEFRRESDSYIQIRVVSKSGGSTSVCCYGSSERGAQDVIRANGPVHLVINRDAGTLTFEGTTEKSHGTGTVSFEPDPAYVTEVSKLTGETLTPKRTLELALADLQLDYVRGIESAGYATSTSELLGLKFSGVTVQYAVALRDAGYDFKAEDLRSLRFSGVDAEWAKKLRSGGYHFDANDLRNLRFSGVDADDAVKFRKAGYELSANELRNLRFSGVSAEYAAAFAEAGYKFTPENLRKLRFSGVPDDYAAELKKAGYDFSAEQLTRLRFSGVPADYATALAVPDRKMLTAEQLINLRMRGVDSEAARQLRE
jgi:hypothetical protein